jgi:hypothetical protein
LNPEILSADRFLGFRNNMRDCASGIVSINFCGGALVPALVITPAVRQCTDGKYTVTDSYTESKSRENGARVNHKRVQRLTRQRGIAARPRGQGRHLFVDDLYNAKRPHQALAGSTPIAHWREGVTGVLGAKAEDMMDNAGTLATCHSNSSRRSSWQEFSLSSARTCL